MTRKIKYALAGVLALSAVGGVAVTAETLTVKGPMRADTNGDGIVSRSEFFAAAESRFKEQDANGNRVLAGDEMKDRAGRFARLDSNNDGKLSFTEQAAGTSALFARLDADGDGKLTPEELGPRHGPRHGPGGPGGPGFAQDEMAPPPPPGAGRMGLQRLDANGDGKITRDEMRAQADARFDRLDTNKDGVIDQTELQSRRGPGGPGGRRGGWRGQGVDDMPPPPPPPGTPAPAPAPAPSPKTGN